MAATWSLQKTYVCDLGGLATAEFPIPFSSDGRGGYEAAQGPIRYTAKAQDHTVWDAGRQFFDRMLELRKESWYGTVIKEEDQLLQGWPAMTFVRTEPAPTVMGTYLSIQGKLIFIEVRGISPRSLTWRPQVRKFLASLTPSTPNPNPPKSAGPEWFKWKGAGYEVNHLRRVFDQPQDTYLFGGLEYSTFADRLFITGKIRLLGETITTAKELEAYARAIATAFKERAAIEQSGSKARNQIYLTNVASTASLGPPFKAIVTANTLDGMAMRVVLSPSGQDLYLRCFVGPPCLVESKDVKNWFASFRIVPAILTKG